MGEHDDACAQRAGRPLPGRALIPEAVDVYARITRGEQPGPAEADAVALLHEYGMIADAGADADGRRVPLPPTQAVWPIAQNALDHLAQQLQALRSLPAVVRELDAHFTDSGVRTGGGSEFLADRGEINVRIGAILAGAERELLSAHPQGSRTREQMELGIPRDSAALERGVAFRTLYQDAVRDDLVTCTWASTMASRGAHFRTLADPFERVIVVDRKCAVISNYTVPEAPEHAAWIVTDQAMVGFIVSAFEQEWRRAQPWHGERRERAAETFGGRLSPLQKAILRGLANGIPQTGVARRQGISDRKVQRELQEIRELWNLPRATPAQLTFHWARSPESRDALERAA